MSRRTVRPDTSRRSASSPPGQSRRPWRRESSVSRRLEVVASLTRRFSSASRTDSGLNAPYRPLMPYTEAGEAPAILVSGLVKSFGSTRALDGVELAVAPSTVLGVLGPNGAGKTTAVRILATLIEPDAGSARVAGLDVVADAPALRARIGLAGQYVAVDEHLTGEENLVMVGRLYGARRRAARARAHELLERFRLADAARRVVKTYSGGMRRRLDLAAALVARPPVLCLDEPTTGLDPRSRLELWETIEALVSEGTTVLLTTQYLDEAERLADRIAVIDHGRVIADGTADELKARVGGERLEVRVADPAQALEAAWVLGRPGTALPQIHGDAGRLPFEGGSGGVADALRRLDEARLNVHDVAVRRPTLDDVFLTLTGHEAEPHDEQVAA